MLTNAEPNQELIKVLIVDDVPANLYALEQILQKDHYQIAKASSGQEALVLMESNDFACCLLDIRMPVMDGFQTAEHIRNSKKTAQLPIIFVTAEYSDHKTVFKGYDLGAVDFLIKPLEPRIVQGKVKVFGDMFLQRQALDRTQEIRDLNIKLTQANADLEHFAQISSHDLQEPLRRQTNFIDLLVHGFSNMDRKEALALLEKIKESSQNIQRMVGDLRELTKLSFAGEQKHRESTDLQTLIQDCAQEFQEEIHSRKITVKYDSSLGSLEVYPVLLKRLYCNLIENGLKYASKDGVELKFTCEQNGKEQIFGVYNTQSSIPQKELKNVFKLFRQAQASPEGHGIGLSICKRIIDRHNGVIWAESGDRFTHIKFSLGGTNDIKSSQDQ